MSVVGRVSGERKYRAIHVWNRILLRLLAAATVALLPAARAVIFDWDHSPDADIAGYRIYWGSSPGAYDSSMAVGYTSTATLDDLPRSQTLYFAVAAVNAAGVESLPSNEVIYTVPANRPPLAIAQRLFLAEDGQLAITLSGTDPDRDPLQYSVVRSPGKGTLSGALPNLTYRPAANFSGSDSFQFTVFDGREISAPVTVDLSILAVNDAPVASPLSVSTAAGLSVIVPLSGSDVDGDLLSFSIVRTPGKGTLSGTPPTLRYTPQIGFGGTDTFTFVARDGKTTSSAATVTVTVAPPVNPPMGYSQTYYATEGQPLQVTLSGRDPLGKTITFSVVTQPNLGTLSGTVPRLTYTPKPQISGIDFFTFQVSNGSQISAPVIIGVLIMPVNDPPVAVSQAIRITAGRSTSIVLAGTDPDTPAGSLRYTVKTSPAFGILTGSAPNLTYQPRAGFLGTDSFQFTVTDGSLTSAAGTVQISVTSATGPSLAGESLHSALMKGAPAFASASIPTLVVSLGGAVRGRLSELSGGDGTEQSTLPQLAMAPAHGSIEFSEDGVFTYTPSDALGTKDQFVLSTAEGTHPIEISFLRLTSDSDQGSNPQWSLETVADARYWVQMSPDWGTRGQDGAATWLPYSWGIEGLVGEVRIPVDSDSAHAWFRVISEQQGALQVTAPVRLE